MEPKAQLRDIRQNAEQVKEITRSLNLFHKPGEVRELRALGVLDSNGSGRRYIASGYFDYDHIAEMAQAAAKLSGRCSGVYMTMNATVNALLARAANRVITAQQDALTKNHEIVSRDFLLIDCDAERPRGIAATAEEHKAALDRTRDCRQFLLDQGWPSPVVINSGNGGYLVFRLDLPNDDNSTRLVKGVLEMLISRFNDGRVEIDPAVSNASRIMRIPGTLNAKGDNIPERPHRLAKFLEVPSTWK